MKTLRVGGLATELCLPDGPGPHPAVLIRTPYDRRRHRAELRAWATRGFAAVAQDVRGRHASTGTWHPYRSEAADGAAALAWIRAQEWSDGRVVAVGASYAAHCALAPLLDSDTSRLTAPETAAAITPAEHAGGGSGRARAEAPRGPDAVIVVVPALGAGEVAREETGPERLLGRAGWWLAHGDRSDSDEGALRRALAEAPGLLDRLPVERLLALPSWPGVWAARRDPDRVRRAASARVPLLAVGGSRDPFAAETIHLWRSWGGPARLVLGPWGHGLTAEPAPEARPEHRLDLGDLYARWARAALAGTLTGRRGALALGGSAHWCAAHAESPHPLPYRFGDPAGLRLVQGADFVADPLRPVRSDRLDIDENAAPPDRCLLLSPPLPRPLDLFGNAEARLVAAARTSSADWAVRLIALRPDGRAEPLATGIVRTAHDSAAPRESTVPLGFIGRRLPAGVRLRVEVAGHHFPAHARNPHTGEDPVTATRLLPSRRTVRMTGSALLLPVVHRPAHIDPVQETLR
ncbi:CocE/NonD family hydrolase [Streptomyces sp. NPDC006551]|uniref:CocE/NonD family hydrolase n=1 Tax=Streptomyces sp. NPDC006551 TaxID=3157178 RepID=UPI0033A921C8